MDSENLIRMANRIGDFFEAMPDRDAALEGIAGHLGKFWEPRMRREFLALADNGAPGLSAIVRAAVERHRGLLGINAGGAG
ncbi:formate dehydrogenase subunit delta [Verminephrobacter aporrectodeae]|uniref:Formate dehydrogenase n=1 Tax=Verminephrobacter aporrectodeae subsp. tuberculatae TaxID=1110392 RepID=A0ABT3KVW8_9BURK|nr:formate dehydrogenase subunit delta [Verminephrobacter aporrectodeae]MCW5222090.1 formate dehydrogenase [Verminephrobacter aporrectodeae subsp. tuberculatae]MCW5258412.1 formate dehydrogenase [Verminephrobacter aporrectodeae subsp. tuberculatae]MCW5291381.1 formate dehydrogenase [Verminephrobacter aporrectodeae subsp. tuberculatae]MCW5322463.1 formate dehydrogenase [Verminephrobacter aporrectodeae subsp. tuberculatae]MCW8175437.1 formate dehydrogenase [Verminephrobacter aporrectodeae subsp.